MNKKFLIILGFISIIALILRIQVSHELVKMDPQVSIPSSFTDMFTYQELSEEILKGGFNKVFYYQPFYYAVFLPIIKSCFGNGIWPVVIIQSLLSALTVWLSGLSASMLRSRKAGILTGLLLTFSTVLILYTPYYLIATLQTFWISLIFYLCVRYIAKFRNFSEEAFLYRFIYSGFIGLVIGISILTRGNIWFFVPGIIFVLIYIEHKNKSIFKKIVILLIFSVFIILPQIPFSYHNSKILGKFTGPSTAAGSVLLLGNTPESPPGGRDPGTGAGPMEYPETCKYWGSQIDNTSVPVQMMKWFAREPMGFIEIQFRKMLLFWDYREIPNNIAVEQNGLRSNILTFIGLIPVKTINTPMGESRYIPFDFIPMSFVILSLGLAGSLFAFIRLFSKGFNGVFRNIKTHLSQYLLLYFIIIYWLGTAIFYILGRFRVPLIPLLAIFAATFLCQFYRFVIKSHRKRLAIQTTLIFLVAMGFVLFGYSFYRFSCESKVMNLVRPDGVQVSLENGTLMIKDNGPMSFGAWNFRELKDGVPIEKEFALPTIKSKKYSVTFKIYFFWKIPGLAVLNINGQEFKFSENSPGLKSKEFILNDISDGKVIIIPEKLDCSLLYFIDIQRDYGRTRINHENPKGELVSSLYIKEDLDEHRTSNIQP